MDAGIPTPTTPLTLFDASFLDAAEPRAVEAPAVWVELERLAPLTDEERGRYAEILAAMPQPFYCSRCNRVTPKAKRRGAICDRCTPDDDDEGGTMKKSDRVELEKIAARKYPGAAVRAYFTDEDAARRRLEHVAELVQLEPAAAGTVFRDVNYQWRYSISSAASIAARALLAND